MVQRLVAQGADLAIRDDAFDGTPLAWAQHNGQQAVVDWMRAHGATDAP
jgi:ankyrin repeat protein